MDKKRSIGMASAELDIPTHVIRFWETQFPKLIKPKIGKGNRRYYYDKEMYILDLIKKYLYQEGYTIKGLQKLFLNKPELFVLGVENIVAETKDSNTKIIEKKHNKYKESVSKEIYKIRNNIEQLKELFTHK